MLIVCHPVGVGGVASEGSTTTIEELSAEGCDTKVGEIGECTGILGSSGLLASFPSVSDFGLGTSVSSVTVGCRFALGLWTLESSGPPLPALPRRKENLRCFGLGEMGWSLNSGGISLRQGLGRAIARAKIVAASIDRGMCDMFKAIRSAF